ncbi:hypothetical protein HZR84_05865 [Hyphobacterium sp. CCMP332]|nr:hypothetical protein HZR84_05865 [Hyphobacterium sp. CCMP332]
MKTFFESYFMVNPVLIWILSLAILNPMIAFTQSTWTPEIQKQGISVYTKAEKYSDFKSFKAEVELPAKIEEVLQVLKDGAHYVHWFGFTKTSRSLKKEGDVQFIYMETIFPWPYANRDMVYMMSFDTKSPNETLIILKGIPDFLPEKRGIVRMEKANGSILLQSEGEITKIRYVFHSEPGGRIPHWLANNSIAELPYQTLLGLRQMLSDKSLID